MGDGGLERVAPHKIMMTRTIAASGDEELAFGLSAESSRDQLPARAGQR
jgi:hypothetical protein